MNTGKSSTKISKNLYSKIEEKINLKHLRFLNKALTIIFFGLSFYVLLSPFIPEANYAIGQATGVEEELWAKYDTEIGKTELEKINSDIELGSLLPPPGANVLLIPKINVEAEILVGDNPKLLDQGMWLRPNTSTPDKGSNTVITGHRYLYYRGPKTFINLDKLNIGDKFLVFWEGKEYGYEVFDILEVDPSQIEVEYPTEESIVTLYTCNLITGNKRLVVKAKLIEKN